MLEVMGENYIRTARAFGLPERMIVYRYALKIAILPTVTLLGVGVGNLLSGAVFAEIVFARPGIGKLIYDMAITRNYPVVQGAVLVTTVAVRAQRAARRPAQRLARPACPRRPLSSRARRPPRAPSRERLAGLRRLLARSARAVARPGPGRAVPR